MTSIFRRKGRRGWTVKHRDRNGRWRMRSFSTEWKADQFRKTVALGGGGPTPTLREWTDTWLAQVEATLRHGTAVTYRWALTARVLPTLGALRLDEISRRHVKDLLLQALASGLKRHTVETIRRGLSACLGAAVDDELIPVNVAKGLPVSLRQGSDPEPVRAMTLDEARAFLTAAQQHTPEWAPLFRLLSLTGMRIGEALALRWADVDWRAGKLHVSRSWSRGRIAGTKTSQGRVVDAPEILIEELRQAEKAAKVRALAGHASEYLFPSPSGMPWKTSIPQAGFKRALGKAGLPGHFTPHSLRHTYARLQLEAGRSVKYVQQQLGHRTIGLTADLYGQWADLGSAEAAEQHASRLLAVTTPVTSESHSGSFG